jgi:zinc transporter ZupT
MSLPEYIALFLTVIAGGWLSFRYSTFNDQWLKLTLSFSGAYIMGITVLHLMPGVFEQGGHNAGFWVLGGFFTQLILEQFSRGIEHGHVHAHQHEPGSFAIQVMIGLSLHALLEGMPLGYFEDFHAHHHQHEEGGQQLLIGIILHKLPAAFALVALLIRSGFNRKVTWTCLVIFALMSPLGALTAGFFGFSGAQIANLLGFVIGSFLHISTTILFEADDTHQHRVSWRKLGVIILGVALSIGADMI